MRSIQLNDAGTCNSLSLGMIKSLIREIEKDDCNKNLRSILLTSEPGKMFSAGHNVKELVRKLFRQATHGVTDPVIMMFFENDQLSCII